MKFKCVPFARLLCATFLCLSSQSLLALCLVLNLNVSGPTSCVQKGVAQTYTATHSGSSACTFYKWSVTGGSIIFNGTNVGSSLCVAESLPCASKATCSNPIVNTTIGSGMSIQVIWNQATTTGTISVEVKEKPDLPLPTLVCTQSLTVNWPAVTDITQTSIGCNASTFSATVPSSCSGATVQWFLGSGTTPVATGNPVSISTSSVTTASYSVRARVSFGGGTSGEYSESYTNPRPVAVSGPGSVNEGSTASYRIDGGVNLTSINWSPPFGLGTIVWNGGTVVDIRFNNVSSNQTGFVVANGQGICGSFSLSRTVTVVNSNPNLRLSSNNTTVNQGKGVSVYPTLLNQGTPLILDFLEEPQNYEVQVFDTNGRVHLRSVASDTQLRLDVSNLPAGMYLVNIRSKELSETTKIVIQD